MVMYYLLHQILNMNDTSDSSPSSYEEEEEEDELTLTCAIEKELKEINDFNALSNSEKIKNIDTYNTFVSNISDYQAQLEEFQTILDQIENPPKTKKKSKPFTNKDFTVAMNKIMEIKKRIDENDISVDDLIELYKDLKAFQMKVVPYLEGKKLEIIKID